MTEAYTDQVELHPGMTVRSHDDEKLGKIVRLQDNQLLVEKGFFFPQDYWIPVSAVENADDDNVYLNLDKDQVLAERWAEGKADWNADAQRAAAGYGIDQPGGTTGSVGAAATAGATNLNNVTTGTTDQTAITGTGYTEDSATAESLAGTESTDTIRVPVYEEELTATKRPVEAGNVQVNKDVVTEERTLDVPITEERVRVTRRAIDRDATGTLGADAFKEGTIDVPVRTEEVDVQKRVRAAEEVDITKEPVERTKRVTGTVRREVVDVEDNTTDVNAANLEGAGTTVDADLNATPHNWGADLPGKAPEAGTDMSNR
jgi:uncharacterized protein (TIGR02271 family)